MRSKIQDVEPFGSFPHGLDITYHYRKKSAQTDMNETPTPTISLAPMLKEKPDTAPPRALERIVEDRTAPGLLLFSAHGEFLSCNAMASRIFGDRAEGSPELNRSPEFRILQAMVNRLCTSADIASKHSHDAFLRTMLPCDHGVYTVCAFRCLDRQFTETATDRSFVAVLLEPIAPTRFALRKGVSRFNLSRREVQVVQALTIGLTDKGIAIALGVRPSTIKAYLRTVRNKLNVSTRTAIVHKVYSV